MCEGEERKVVRKTKENQVSGENKCKDEGMEIKKGIMTGTNRQ